jgi:DNA repair exonuclease SbcCD nuclease subunit
LNPAEAWRRLVDEAVQHRVQAVVLAGDVVDQDEDRFEAWGHLREGVAKLIAAGVRVLGVAGNHDHFALPRLAERIPDFHLVGANGVWERVELDGVDLIGWSFPQRHHRADPLQSTGLRAAVDGRRQGVTALGVLHAHLDAQASEYAPVRREDLSRQGLNGWFLGHIHQPHDLTAPNPVGYLGTLVGLDRSETGRRGPWLVEPATPTIQARQLALGPVHWVALDVDLSALEPGDDAHDKIHAALESCIATAVQEDRWLRDGSFAAVGCSVRLAGRTDARAAVRSFIAERKPDELVFRMDGTDWAVVHLADDTRPRLDLARLAAAPTPPGQLARLLIDLESEGGASLPTDLSWALTHVDPRLWTPDLRRDPLPDAVSVVRRAALALLDQLLDQQTTAEVA